MLSIGSSFTGKESNKRFVQWLEVLIIRKEPRSGLASLHMTWSPAVRKFEFQHAGLGVKKS